MRRYAGRPIGIWLLVFANVAYVASSIVDWYSGSVVGYFEVANAIVCTFGAVGLYRLRNWARLLEIGVSVAGAVTAGGYLLWFLLSHGVAGPEMVVVSTISLAIITIGTVVTIYLSTDSVKSIFEGLELPRFRGR